MLPFQIQLSSFLKVILSFTIASTILNFLILANSKSDHKLEQANISQTKTLIDKLSLNDDENGNGHDNIFENRKDDNENSNVNENEDEDEDNIESKRYNEDMDFLLGMVLSLLLSLLIPLISLNIINTQVPDFDQDLVQFIYEIKCNGIKDDAARYILEHCLDTSNDDVSIIKFEKAQYDTKRRAEQQQEKEEERKLQKNIVRRYGEKILLPKYDKYGRYNALKSKPIIMSFGNDNKKQDRVRYRENAVASTKGEKFIVEKTPEYDGGSRGKVMPKGKRGPGWI